MQLSSIVEAVDAVVSQVFERGGIVRPPVDAVSFAGDLGVVVALDGAQQGRARQTRIAGTPAIFLRPDDRPERLQWAAAHELGEVFASDVFQQSGLADDEFQQGFREQLANLFASRLLLPVGWFEEAAQTSQADLFELKSVFTSASHELIAMRLLDLPLSSVVSVFDQGQLTRRKGTAATRPPAPCPDERRCQLAVHESGAPRTVEGESIVVQGWPVNEAGWKREILRATPLECEEW